MLIELPGIVRKEGSSQESINPALRLHQVQTATTWQHHEFVSQLHKFFDLFNRHLFAAHPLPPAAISLDCTRRSCLGHYVPGRNGTGLLHNISLNSAHIGQRSVLRQLATLAHEMIHEQQELYGTPSKTAWYHNREFCQMAAAIGLVCNFPRGHLIKLTDPFLSLCRERGIDEAEDATPVPAPPLVIPATSTLRKWFCRCNPPVNVRVAIRDFDATCNRCGEKFCRSE